MLSTRAIAFQSTLYTGEASSSGFPVWAWVIFVIVGLLLITGAALLFRARGRAGCASQRAADKLAKAAGVDGKTRRALDRAASQLELKSPAGLLLSATALAEAVQRCDSLKETDKDRLRKLAIQIAQDRAQHPTSITL